MFLKTIKEEINKLFSSFLGNDNYWPTKFLFLPLTFLLGKIINLVQFGLGQFFYYYGLFAILVSFLNYFTSNKYKFYYWLCTFLLGVAFIFASALDKRFSSPLGGCLNNLARSVCDRGLKKLPEAPNITGIDNLSEKTKEDLIAESIIGRNVFGSKSYKNTNSSKKYIAGYKNEISDRFLPTQVFLLESFGDSFREVWKSSIDQIYGYDDLKTVDIDGDGNKEIVFRNEGFGTGAGVETLFIYSVIRDQLFEISKEYDWSILDEPINPNIRIKPESDKAYLSAIERYAKVSKFIEPIKTLDFDNPIYAMQRWRKENANKKTGPIVIHWFQGRPLHNVVNDVYEEENQKGKIIEDGFENIKAGEIEFISCWKGALYAYSKTKNQHFVIYAPAWAYDWARCLTYDGSRLWFTTGTFGESLVCFDYEKRRGQVFTLHSEFDIFPAWRGN